MNVTYENPLPNEIQNLNEAMINEANQNTTLLNRNHMISENEISIMAASNPLNHLEPIQETGDEVFGNIPDPIPGPASRRRKGGFRKSRKGSRKNRKTHGKPRKSQKSQKSRRAKN